MTWIDETSPGAATSGGSGAALALIAAGVDALAEVPDPTDLGSVRGMLEGLETQARRLDAAKAALVGVVESGGLFRRDGHRSTKAFCRHVNVLSDPEVAHRVRCAKAMGDLPAVAAAWKSGSLATCAMRRIALCWANPRVRDALIRDEAAVLTKASALPYKHFHEWLSGYEARVDTDGTIATTERNHANRDLFLHQDFNQGWTLTGGCGSYDGAELNNILDGFIQAEFMIDWDQAHMTHGDNTNVSHLARTAKQRRFDALMAMARQAVTATPGQRRPMVDLVVVIDQETYERALIELAGGTVTPDDPLRETYRCSTIDGVPINPREAVAASLAGTVRRAIIAADSTVIDLGRRRRLFTGSARLAAQIADTECTHPSCQINTSKCQIDHLQTWQDEGETNPGNAGPGCGFHNRWRNHGYTTTRDPTGNWHTYRPDGTEIT